MKRSRTIGTRHRRDWRRLWRYCRCGYRWRCPDSVELVPRPYEPTVPPLDRAAYRRAVQVTAVVAVPGRVRAVNQRSAWRVPGRNTRPTGTPTDRSRYAAGRVPS
ncbi:hypothetical protein [Plantactinospora endophytica]|uniref:hypothetical protein n=1 Tax=Plantactinospora endophytica TaxID=673535 RepID=UPI0019404DD0|nr:hypothetical protein [Plantactinospora endophytica]